jgi:membrane protein
VLATVLFELAKRGFGNYIASANYEKVFGALALLPILLVWVYVSWLVVLLGASLSASLGAYRFDVEDGHWPAGLEVLACVRVLRVVRDQTAAGTPPNRDVIGEGLAGASAEQVDGAIERLLAVRAIERSTSGGYVPIVDPERITLFALFPNHPPRTFDSSATLPCGEETATAGWLAAYRQGNERALKVRLSELLDPPGGPSPRTPPTS